MNKDTSDEPQVELMGKPHRIGIAADHGGFELKEYLIKMLSAAGYAVTDFGDRQLRSDDDYPDFIIPLAQAVAAGTVDRGVGICGSGVGASVTANKVAGVRACLIDENFSAHQGVEDDNLNMICFGGLLVGHAFAWELVQTFLAARFKGAERFRRRLAKVAALETTVMNKNAMKNECARWVTAIAMAVLGFCVVSCANNSATVPEAEYSTNIVGCWQGTVGDSKETMSIKGDGTFVCQLYPTGFIANTLSQGVKGTIRGTWKISAAIITLNITGAKKERLENTIADSTILAFKKDELVLKSDGGGTSSFQRVRVL